MRLLSLLFALVCGLQFFAPNAQAMGRMKQNTGLIDERAGGFAIYRVSEPNAADMKSFCRAGITEMMVLSGDGHIDEALAREHCPAMKIVFNEKTSSKIPLSEEFIASFDRWVDQSARAGKKIAFRCHCGCHRTGRLAAYYQMRYQGLNAKQPNKVMKQFGKYMVLFPQLDNQVRALEDFIRGRACSEKQKHCVRTREPSRFEVDRALATSPEI